MLELTMRLIEGIPEKTLTLALEQRTRSRLRVTLDDGTPAGLFLDRGQVLRDGDLIASAEGIVVRIKAAAETVSSVLCDDPLLLARACYHLGNRHVPLQIGDRFLCYQHDHVLDEMLRGVGLQPRVEHRPFQPEPGAYGGHAAGHGRQHHQVHDDHAH